jgi:hypothetical protein
MHEQTAAQSNRNKGLIQQLNPAMTAKDQATSGSDTSSKNKSHYRPEVDGLRALALIAVIINHFDKTVLPSGFLGVDIFFVISGFVITT